MARRRKLANAIAALALTALSFLEGCGEISPPPDIHPEQPDVVSLDPRNWYIFYSSAMPHHPSADPSGAWSFAFPPSEAGGHVNYVQTPFNTTGMANAVTITFRIESEAPEYELNDPSDKLPATVRLFFEQQNDDLVKADGRWWAPATKYDLGSQDNSTITFVVPFTWDRWTNVYGEQDPQSFSAALKNIGWIGVTFGGQSFAGHGAALSKGSAKYVLISLHTD